MTINERFRHSAIFSVLPSLIFCSATSSVVFAQTVPPSHSSYDFDGVKMDEVGHPFDVLGSTISLRRVNESPVPSWIYGPSFASSEPSFQAGLPVGKYELGVQVPSGYDAQVSVCERCEAGETAPFEPLGPFNGRTFFLHVVEHQNVHVEVKFTRQPDVVVSPANESLVCNIPGVPKAAQPTDQLTLNGTSVGAKLGIDAPLGGIGVKLDLINLNVPQSPLQVIEARSAGGAAWQTAITVGNEEANTALNYNQAAGNSASMWGFGGSYSPDRAQGFMQTDWSPLYSNDYQTPLAAIGTSAATITNTTPCYHTGYRLADGQVQLGALLRTQDGASTIQVTNKYAVRATKEVKRTWLQVDQAMYLRRDSGRAGNLRVIAAVTNGAETSFSKPVFPYVHFTSDESAFWKAGGCDKLGCQLASVPISYAILIWNVQGQDAAIVVHQGSTNTPFSAFVRLLTTCLPGQEPDVCGNIQFHARVVDSHLNPSQQTSFTAGQVYPYGLEYEVGTPEQLKALGFAMP